MPPINKYWGYLQSISQVPEELPHLLPRRLQQPSSISQLIHSFTSQRKLCFSPWNFSKHVQSEHKSTLLPAVNPLAPTLSGSSLLLSRLPATLCNLRLDTHVLLILLRTWPIFPSGKLSSASQLDELAAQCFKNLHIWHYLIVVHQRGIEICSSSHKGVYHLFV